MIYFLINEQIFKMCPFQDALYNGVSPKIFLALTLLANGVNVNTTGDNNTPLHCTSQKGHVNMIELLIANGGQ